MEKTKIKDIFNGEYINAWVDEGFVFVSFPWCTMNFPKENWKEVQKDLKKLGMVK